MIPKMIPPDRHLDRTEPVPRTIPHPTSADRGALTYLIRWVKAQTTGRPVKSWAKGVEDYLTHIAEIKSEFRDVLEASTTNKNGDAPMKPVPAAPTPSLFGTPAPAPVPASTPAAASVPPPLFGSFAAPTAPAAAAPTMSFPEAANNPFSLKPSSTPLFGSGPSSSIPAAPLGSLASPAFGGFGAGGFGAAPVPVSPLTIPPSTPEGDEDDDEEKRPPSPSFKEKERTDDDTEECLMRCKVKFFTKKDPTDPWGDHGVNHMELLREKVASDGKTRKVRIICRNSIGKAVLNAGLYKGMSVVVTEKKKPDGSTVKNGVIANLFNAAEEMVKKTTMFRLGKPEDVEKLHKYLTESVAQL